MISSQSQIKWTAQIDQVVEVSLLGSADLDYWKSKLAPINLLPIERDNKARILIITADARFHGVRFKELSLSVLAHHMDDPTDGAFLAQAWNSSRFFAWCERTFFQTPYTHADVQISAANPTSIHFAIQDQTLFRANLNSTNASPRQPTSISLGGWSGPIFLPSRNPTAHPKYFFARLHGLTETYPFLPDTDSLTINPASDAWSLQTLLDSHFTPELWEIRRTATHARSKTHTHRSSPASTTPA